MSSDWTESQILDQLAGRLLSSPGPKKTGRSDYDLNPDFKDRPGALSDAAVLVPLVKGRPWSVLFTQRAEGMTSHAGQISFPGGRVDPGDRDYVHTALRETHEEIGVTADQIEIAGFLDTYETRTGYRITPVVGLIEPGFQLDINADEVADVFEVPLQHVLDGDSYETHSLEWQGKMRFFYAVSYQNHYIWGATAGMLKSLHDRVNKT